MKKIISFLLAFILIISVFSGCSEKSLLDKNNPVVLEMWHVYGEQADSPMNRLVEEFNNTVGKDKGIVINVSAITNTTMIGNQLLEAQSGALGAPNMPDLFFCHNNNAEALGADNLIDWKKVLSEKEINSFVEDFVEDGMVGEKLSVLPVSKSTHVLFINATQFNKFSKETGVSLRDLETWDGFFAAAEKFYEWSGKPMCAFDYILRAMELSLLAQGVPQSEYYKNGWYNTENAKVKEAWLKFASAIAKGHIVVSDLYSNTQIMTGEVISGIGSCAAILYYNDTVTYADNTSEPLDLIVLPIPQADKENKLTTQAGVGLAAYKTTEQKSQAAAVFARWLTEDERNLSFVSQTGYMPVSKNAQNTINDFSFEKASYQSLYNALGSIISDATLVKEPSITGYYNKVNNFYNALRAFQKQVNERRNNGESAEALAEETWEMLKSLS